MKPSRRSDVPGFEVMSILAEIEKLRAAGRDIISLTAGEPGSGAPPAVNAAAAEVHGQNTVLNYSPSFGIAPLRQALAEHYSNWHDVDIPVERIAVTTGSSGAFVLSFLAAFDPGDRVALARPGYPAYRNILTSLGIEVVELDCGPEVRFQPTAEQLEAEVAANGPLKGLMVASPANPTGTMVSRQQLTELAQWCRSNEVQLISDEIYHGITFEQPGVSAAEVDEQAVIISSFSKYWGMPGWRLGWTVLPEYLVDPVARLAGNVALCPPHGSQIAAVKAFSAESMAFAEEQLADYAAARELVLNSLEELGWGNAAPADGAFYVYAHLGDHLKRHGDATSYAKALLHEAGVAVVPGSDFDPVNGHEWIRLSLAPGSDAVRGGLERIRLFHG
ncbi:aminotransferase class I/II-fold pyridoxal phosphate-dependent enzyme [Nesterenkonia sp. MY13]|uniref:Aminotransferase n=1 Tax=Nesterenkonia sedimenti TaxID=1463632 RepID=A0A7X8TIV2_9MICC|nr:aminotransferase class I/II-fold pyridoxal phosphate-dependent enzyme [Nesterenkonia sedimenti]NLS09137.1 aminotransferase class I/II-fold pyridoxal phosphate-dependent enzyme [Nesterenkonia sedimenti]